MHPKRVQKWQARLIKITIWIAAEILLTVIGIDDLADYGEYVFERDVIVFNG
ncbi:MAG TPA: hypothetical protein V6D10_04460 [Trichocoleus sp.]|jgi:hypothetical protein